MGRLDGKVVVITGGARGMGAAHVRNCWQEGASLVITDVLADEGQALADSLGDRAVFVRHDVADDAAWAEVIETATWRFDGVDVLVNNAGVHWTSALEDETVDGMRLAWEVNTLGPFLGMQAAIAPMRARGGGSIINISSLAGTTGLGWHSAYGASKWAVRGLSRTAANELGADRIRVNTIMPGAVETSMLPPDREGLGNARFARLPLARAGTPDEVSSLVVFLASDESSYITGGEFAVDGGSSAGPPLTPRPATAARTVDEDQR